MPYISSNLGTVRFWIVLIIPIQVVFTRYVTGLINDATIALVRVLLAKFCRF